MILVLIEQNTCETISFPYLDIDGSGSDRAKYWQDYFLGSGEALGSRLLPG